MCIIIKIRINFLGESVEDILIIYKDFQSNNELGREIYQGLTEVTFPDVNFRNHPITITKMFSNQSYHRWIVKNVTHSSTVTTILLSSRDNSSDEEFLRKTYLNHSNILSNLTIGTFVEVDFGYIHSTKKSNGNLGSIKRYPDLANDGEMHKRRLCVVVKACSDHVQVVPISSQEQILSDQSICLISHDSLHDLVNYNQPNRNSYSLAHMVEAVSLNRVLPPKSRNKDGVYRNNRYLKRLNKTDLKIFITSLAFGVALTDFTKIKAQNSKNFIENKQLKQELETQTTELEALKVKFEELTSKLTQHEATKYLLEDTYKNLGRDIGDIPKEIKELHEILASE